MVFGMFFGIAEIFIIVLFIFLLPLIALIDILRSKFEGNNKVVWVLVVIFLTIIGAILYFTIGKNQKIKDSV